MKRFLTSIFVLLLTSVASAEIKPVSVNDVLHNLDPSISTSFQITKYRIAVQGKHIDGIGTVTDVKQNTDKKLVNPTYNKTHERPQYTYTNYYNVYMYVGNNKNISIYDYNVHLQTLQDASNIKVGERIKFLGLCEKVGENNKILNRSGYPLISLINGKFNDEVKNYIYNITEESRQTLKNEPEGFRGIKWGEEINKNIYTNMKCRSSFQGTPQSIEICEKINDNFDDYKGLEISKIDYIWWNGKLWSGIVYISNSQNIVNVREMLVDKYNMSGERIESENTVIVLRYVPIDSRSKYRIIMRSVKLEQERKNLGLKID